METITRKKIEEWLTQNEIQLSPTHKKLCIPVINRIYRKMSAGIRFPGIKVENDTICDGHHRYVASLLARLPIETIPSIRKSSKEQWKAVVFEEDE